MGQGVVEAGTPGEFVPELDPADWAELERHGHRRRVPAGAPLFVEGTRSEVVVVLLSGRVKVFCSTAGGAEVVLAVRGPGTLLGELAAIDARPRSASVTALEPVESLSIGLAEFTRFLQTHPRAMWVLLRQLTGRLREADRKRVEFGSYDTLGRVAQRLLELTERFGEPTESGIRITLPFSQQELAGWVCASREVVAKALRTLRTRGCLHTQRRSVLVLDLAGLRRYAR